MSSTNRGADRDPLDRYPTPRWCVHRLLEARALPGGLWVEPCAGAGSIVRAVDEVRDDVRWLCNEISRDYGTALQSACAFDGIPIDLITHEDAQDLVVGPGAAVIITNPPFNVSAEILVQMLVSAPGALVVFLQRIGWGGGPRAELFRDLKPSMYQLPERPSFKDVVTVDPETGKRRTSSQDSTEYCWFVFDGLGCYAMLASTPDEVRAKEKAERRAVEKGA